MMPGCSVPPCSPWRGAGANDGSAGSQGGYYRGGVGDTLFTGHAVAALAAVKHIIEGGADEHVVIIAGDQLKCQQVNRHDLQFAAVLQRNDFTRAEGAGVNPVFTLAGVNDQRKHAEKLALLLRSYDFKCHVNLIPYNETDSGYVRSSPEQIRAFKNRLIGHALNATIRKERGTSIQAACDQLRRHHLGNTH